MKTVDCDSNAGWEFLLLLLVLCGLVWLYRESGNEHDALEQRLGRIECDLGQSPCALMEADQ